MILIAPSRRCAAEPPLDRDVESKLLLARIPNSPRSRRRPGRAPSPIHGERVGRAPAPRREQERQRGNADGAPAPVARRARTTSGPAALRALDAREAPSHPPRALRRSMSTARSTVSPGRTIRRNRASSTPPNNAASRRSRVGSTAIAPACASASSWRSPERSGCGKVAARKASSPVTWYGPGRIRPAHTHPTRR